MSHKYQSLLLIASCFSRRDFTKYYLPISLSLSLSLSPSFRTSLESIPGRRLESHQDPGATGSGRDDMFDFARRPCKYALFEDVAAGGQFSSGIQTDLRHGTAVDQLAGMIVLGGVLAAHHALLL